MCLNASRVLTIELAVIEFDKKKIYIKLNELYSFIYSNVKSLAIYQVRNSRIE